MKPNPPLTVYVYNGVEHEWEFITHLKTRKKRDGAIRASTNLADTYLFANPNSTCVFVSPLPLDSAFVRYAEALLDSHFTILVPKPKSHSLAHNLTNDKTCIATIKTIAKRFNNNIILKSYSSSPGIHAVATVLKKNGLSVALPETTDASKLSAVYTYGSKSGFRNAFSRYMPKGYICRSPNEALQRAEELYNQGEGVVCKTDRGCAGEGVHIFKKKGGFAYVKDELAKIFVSQPYWHSHPIVVEAYVRPTMHDCPFPSIEGYIDAKGKLSFPYYCNMIVTPKGEFFGVEIHKRVLSSSLAKKLMQISTHIGRTYVQAGYRGTFDIDFLHSAKKLYANESNMRTNGGTDTYITARKLIGRDFFTSRYVLSNYFTFSQNKKYTFPNLVSLLSKHLYNATTKTGVIIGSALALRQRGVSYMIIAKSPAEANKLQKKLILTIKKNQE